jgi:glycosyltransferase involved in cell wall biosynthesis
VRRSGSSSPSARPVRVLIVNGHGDDPSCGGAERVVAALASHLTAHGMQVAYLQAFPQRLPGLDVERTVLHGRDWRDDRAQRLKSHVGSALAAAGASLEGAVARHEPDLVHTHNLQGIGTGVWEVCRRLGIPVVHTIHDYYLLCPRVTLTKRDGSPCRPSPLVCGFRTRRLARWAPAVSQVIGCSQYVLDLHAHLFPTADFHVLRNPVEPPLLAQLPAPRKQPSVLGYLGSLDRVKGVHLLLEAAPRLASLGFSLRLAGDGRLREDVATVVEANRHVRWEGPLFGEEKRRFLADCDLGVVPSIWAEPGGPTFTMVEWLAAHRPVLVSDRGGLGEVAGVYPGTVAVPPEVDAIVDAVAGVRDGPRWGELVEAAAGDPPIDTTASWAGKQETLYRRLIG